MPSSLRLFLPVGRMRRRDYFFCKLALYVLSYASLLLLIKLPYEIGGAVFPLTLLFLTYWEVVLFVKRLHDNDSSGWMVLLLAIPFVNLGILIYSFIGEGTIGPNKYGPDPVKHRKPKEPVEEERPEAKKDIYSKIDDLQKERDNLPS